MTLSTQKRRLHDMVFEALATDIITGALALDTRLPIDSALGNRFEVSRTVIREAIQALASAGLVDVRHGAGTYVNGSASWDLLDTRLLEMLGNTGTIDFLINDLLDVRRMFEVEAAGLAAERATAADIAALEVVVERMRDPKTTGDEYLELNLEFHSLIVQASHNRILTGLRHQMRGVLSVMMNARQRQADEEMRIVSTAMHQMLLDSIREGRADRAQAVMLAHVQGAERSLQRTPES
ncbi:FadR/GntR family transcriptional regulator [Advenella kashmirensis]